MMKFIIKYIKAIFYLIALFAAFVILVVWYLKSQRPELPRFLTPIRITAKLYEVKEYDIFPIDHIDIPIDEMANFQKLVIPNKNQPISINESDYHLADVIIYYRNDLHYKFLIRWSGKNPAAVSIDGINYYYANYDNSGFPDGGFRIVRLLKKYSLNKKSIN